MSDILSNIKSAANGTPYIGVVPSTCTDIPEAGYDPYEAGFSAGKYQASLNIEVMTKNAWREGYKQGFADGCSFWKNFSQKGKEE